MENDKSLVGWLRDYFSDKKIYEFQTLLKSKGINPKEIIGIYGKLTDENDFGLIRVDGKKVKLDFSIQDMSQEQLILDGIVFTLKMTDLICRECTNTVSQFFWEHQTRRIARIRSCCDNIDRMINNRLYSSRDNIENQINELNSIRIEALLEIDNLYIAIEKHENSKLPVFAEKHAGFEKMLEELVICYFESVNSCISGLYRINEFNDAEKMLRDGIDKVEMFINHEKQRYDTELLKAWDKDFYNKNKDKKTEKENIKHEIWDEYLNNKYKQLQAVLEGEYYF